MGSNWVKAGRSILFWLCWTHLTSFLASQPLPTITTHRCGTVEYEQTLRNYYPFRENQVTNLDRQLARQFSQRKQQGRQAVFTSIFRIPVVVHVIHANASQLIGGPNNPNISDEQIRSQIQVLNEDYRNQLMSKGDLQSTGNDAGIEFFLAQTDPYGLPTNGITRHYYPQQTEFKPYSVEDALTLSQISCWSSDHYLNIWVTSLSGSYLGYTQYPSSSESVPGLTTNSDERTDGSVIDYRFFGRQTGTVTSKLYGYGRTVTHEIGHWLGLYHPWGDTNCGDDFVEDTPLTEGPNPYLDCRPVYSNCLGNQTRNLIEDIMDYSTDRCMSLFTVGQIERMRMVLQLSPRRSRLVQSNSALDPTKQLSLTLYPNPVLNEATITVQFSGVHPLQLTLYNELGAVVWAWSHAECQSLRLTLPFLAIPQGRYLLAAETDNERVSRSILVD